MAQVVLHDDLHPVVDGPPIAWQYAAFIEQFCRIPGTGLRAHALSGWLIAARSTVEPQGRPDNGSGSQPMVQGSTCSLAMARSYSANEPMPGVPVGGRFPRAELSLWTAGSRQTARRSLPKGPWPR